MTVIIESGDVHRAIGDLRKGTEDLTRALMNAGNLLVGMIQHQMMAGASPDGTPFVPLKSRVGVPLSDTGQHIRNRINAQMEGENSVLVGMFDSESNKIGRVHQFGATIRPVRAKYLRWKDARGWHRAKQVTIPARPFMPISPNGEADLPQEWVDDIVGVIRASLAAK